MYMVSEQSAQVAHAMRISIEIDDELLAEAMKATGHRTKKATVDVALRKVVVLAKQQDALE
jgi:Arc/MetJ family transcription regulator